MTKRKEDSSSPGYSVGYGKPPVATRFQPGRSGNPTGGSKGGKETEATIVRVLNETVVVAERGKTRRMPVEELIVRQQKTKAINGDLKSAKFLLEQKEKYGKPAEPVPVDQTDLSQLSDEELATLTRILEKASRAASDGTPDEDC